MKRLLTIFLLLTLLIVPAFADTYSYTAATDQAIWSVDMVIQQGTYGTFTATLADGSTASGSFSYEGFPIVTANMGLGSDTGSTAFVNGFSGPLYTQLWNGDNTTDGRVLRYGYGLIKGVWNNVLVTTISRSPITSFTATYSGSATFSPTTVTYKEASEKLAADSGLLGTLQGWYDWLIVFLPQSKAFIDDLIYWIQFFFIDNLAMIVALFLAVPMAFAAKNSRGNPEKFLRQYFKTLRGFFEFVLSLWRMLLESIGTIRGWFRV